MTAPRPTRKPVVMQSENLSEWEKYHLLKGHDFFGDGYGRTLHGNHDGEDRERMQADWERHRDALLAEWISVEPGTRPYAWWTFDAPERRRRIDGKPHPFDNPERKARIESDRKRYPNSASDPCKLWYGRPGVLMTLDDFEAKYETEADYLRRLGLLLPGEEEMIAEYVPTDPPRTRTSADGTFKLRYLRCSVCRQTAGSPQFVPTDDFVGTENGITATSAGSNRWVRVDAVAAVFGITANELLQLLENR